MKKSLDRVLVVQPQEELRAYTSSLLSEIGFRHVLLASTMAQAQAAVEAAQAKKQPIQLVVCDDSLPEGAIELERLIRPIPCAVIAEPTNPRNLRLAARLGVSSLVFRPYGKVQVERVVGNLLGDL